MGSAGGTASTYIQKQFEKFSADQSYWCIQLLEKLGPDGLTLLIKFCKAPDKDVRREAINKLQKFEDPAILQTLVACLDDAVWINRKCASLVLESKAGSMPVLETIQTALQQGSENLTFWVLRIMSRLVGADPNNPVHAFLKHPNLRIKCAAIQAMGHMVDSQSIPILIGHLNDPSWIVRKSAASAIMERGAEAETFLKSAFKEGSHDMKFWAIKIMAKMTGASRLSTYRGFIQGQVEELKFYGMQALSEIRNPDSIEILVDCFRDKSWSVRKFASEQIASMGNIGIPILIDKVACPEDDVKYWCIRTMADMGFVAFGALKNLISSADKNIRKYVLGVIEPPLPGELTASLVRCLDDEEASVQKMASDLLIEQGVSSSRYLVGQLFNSNVNTAYWSKKILVSLRNQNIDDLIDWLEEDEPARNKAANFFTSVSALDLPRILNSPMDDLKELINTASDATNDDDPFKMSGVFSADSLGMFSPDTGSFGAPAVDTAAAFDVSKTGVFHPDSSQPMTGGELDHFLKILHERDGSDLHMSPGSKPIIRIHGQLVILEDYDILTRASTERMVTQMLSADQRRKLERDLAIDCSYEIDQVARFRVNLFNQRRGLNGVYRIIPTVIPTFEELKMAPEVFTKFCSLKQGLVLVTGPTGSGKSSTLASMIDYINQNRREHIITVEDPIEFVHDHKKCLVSQREVGHHCRSFADALRSALREDPDIILVGEMRDLETISLAITAAETGHLVFATLHTTNAGQTIDRMIDAYPPHQQPQVRVQLSNSVQAIIAQRLLPLARGGGRVPSH